MHVMSVARFERFFRLAGSLDIDKEDLKRLDDFIDDRIYALLVASQFRAKQNLRDVIQPQDLPITKGLQENIERFRKLNEEVELQPILDQLANRPRLDMAWSDETEALFPELAGGLTVALARTFRLIDPTDHHPHGEQWDRCRRVFEELL